MLTHKGTQDIRTERLLLRRFKLTDAEEMYANWESDVEVTRFLSWSAHESVDETREILEKWIAECEREDTYHWAIERDGEVIGDLNVFNMSDKHSSCELGYVMSRANWGNGYMTEAVRGAIDFLFGEVNMHRIAARHATENAASGSVMQKAGMLHEGTFRKVRLNRQGEYYDLENYAILREEWETNKA